MKSLVILKPDGVHRNLFGSLVEHLKRDFLQIDEYKVIDKPASFKLDEHYDEYINEDWYDKLSTWMINGPIIVMSVVTLVPEQHHDDSLVEAVRTSCNEFRRINKINFTYNTVHSSDSAKQAVRELKIWGLYP